MALRPKFLLLVVEHIDRAGLGARELHRLGGDGSQHVLEVEGRVHRLADLSERAQLAHRLRQLAGPGFDLLLEVRVGILQLRRHVVELVGERLELVAGPDRYALAQIAAADARGAGLQGPYRHQHLARQEHAGKHCERERREQDQAGALDRGVKSGRGLLARQLDEHQPIERGNPGMGGKHGTTLQAFGNLQRRGLGSGNSGARRLHLCEAGKVDSAQHQIDVGVGDQTAVAVDHVGLPPFADLDLRHDVPHELEIDLGDTHPRIAACPGE